MKKCDKGAHKKRGGCFFVLFLFLFLFFLCKSLNNCGSETVFLYSSAFLNISHQFEMGGAMAQKRDVTLIIINN